MTTPNENQTEGVAPATSFFADIGDDEPETDSATQQEDAPADEATTQTSDETEEETADENESEESDDFDDGEDIDDLFGDEEEEADDADDSLEAEALALIEKLDPKLEEASPEVYKRLLEQQKGVLKLVKKNKQIQEGFEAYSRLDAALHNPTTSEEATRRMLEYLNKQSGLNLDRLFSSMGYKKNSAGNDYDDDDLDYGQAPDTSKLKEQIMGQIRSELTPVVEQLKSLVAEQDKRYQKGADLERLKALVPKVKEAMKTRYQGFDNVTAREVALVLKNADAKHTATVSAATATVISQYADRLSKHLTAEATKRVKPANNLAEQNSMPAKPKSDPARKNFGDYLNEVGFFEEDDGS